MAVADGPGRPAGPAGSRLRLVNEQVRRAVRGGDGRPQRQFRPRRPRRGAERNRDHHGAGGQVPGGRAHRPHQGVGPHHQVGRAGHQREQQQPGLQLASGMPELADLAAVQRAPGGVAEHRAAAEFRAHVGWMAPQVPERAVLRLTAAGHRAAQPDQASLRCVPPGAFRRLLAAWPHREPLGDVQDGEWRALRVFEQDLARVRRDRSAGTSSVTAAGQGVPSASVPRSATEATSAPDMKPVSGANAPVRSSSRSPSWPSSRVRTAGSRIPRPARQAPQRSRSPPSGMGGRATAQATRHAGASPRLHGPCPPGQVGLDAGPAVCPSPSAGAGRP